MDRKLIWVTLLLAVTLMVGAINVDAYHVASPICNYLLVGPSNTSGGAETSNQTFKAVISTTSNQTQRATGGTFIRLENQNGAALSTNYTGKVTNTSGETAEYETSYALDLDDSQTYKVSATWYFLNNSFYNYSYLSKACDNVTFVVKTTEGFVGSVGIQAAEEKAGVTSKANIFMIFILILAAIVVIFKDKN